MGRKKDRNTYRRASLVILLTGSVILLLAGCSLFNRGKSPLNPDDPVSVTLWHYYNGQTKEYFDQLVSEFNDTVGMQQGIVIDAKSQGDVKQLEIAVYDAANQKIGAQPMPDVFAAYPDTAYRVHQLVGLVEMEDYFSKEEIQQFNPDFLDEGRFGNPGKLRIIPVAKSTENLYLNKTFWDPFAKANGAELDDLKTWEGVVRTARAYYDWSGGKAFLGIDSNSNFMLVSAIQLGHEMYDYSRNPVKLDFQQEVARRIWDHFYVPYIKGYFLKSGRFASDDAKIGKTIAYTGSTAGAAYFPKEVTLSQSEVYPIEGITLPYPYFEQSRPYAVQQGAGLCITKSDKAHEYAAAQFIKWFTDVEQNMKFALSTGYFPVKTAALEKNHMLAMLQESNASPAKTIISSIQTTADMLNTYRLYGYKPFDGSFEMRQIWENHLFAQVQNDLTLLQQGPPGKEEKARITDGLISEHSFKKWYQGLLDMAPAVLK